VLVSGAVEGNVPSLTRPEPMFDLSALEQPVSRSQRRRARLEDERRLFRMVLGRARHRVLLTAADAHGDGDDLSIRSRFGDELPVNWVRAPEGPFDEPVSVREATASWRRSLADPSLGVFRRLAALEGLVALGVDPSRWWFQRDWTDNGRPLHDTLRLSYSKLSTLGNCELQHVLSDELGLGRAAGYQAWVGKTVHKLIEDCERGSVPRTLDALIDEVDARWNPREFPSKAVSEAFRREVRERMVPNWFAAFAEGTPLAVEERFEFEFDGVLIVGVIDRIGPLEAGGTRITDYKTGKPENAGRPEESLQLGIYWLAVQLCDDLAPYRPVRAVELAFVKGDWRTPQENHSSVWQVGPAKEEAYQARVRESLSALIAREKDLLFTGVYHPNPYASCRFCDFKTLCPLFPEGSTPLEPRLEPQGVAG
jgi:RecB family exonuclease